MPALRHLEVVLHGLDLGDGGLFTGLQLCTQLTALHLDGSTVCESTAIAAAAAVARLSNLRELGLTAGMRCHVCPSALVKHLTALTSLCIHNHRYHDSSASLYAAAARNPGLLSFSVDHSDDFEVPAPHVQQLIEACPSLAHLNFQATTVQQDAQDVLLTHGTNINSLRAHRVEPDSSIAGRQVSWRKLFLTDDYPTALHLANLPLQSRHLLAAVRQCGRTPGIGAAAH
jgi:hypothetical protein